MYEAWLAEIETLAREYGFNGVSASPLWLQAFQQGWTAEDLFFVIMEDYTR